MRFPLEAAECETGDATGVDLLDRGATGWGGSAFAFEEAESGSGDLTHVDPMGRGASG